VELTLEQKRAIALASARMRMEEEAESPKVPATLSQKVQAGVPMRIVQGLRDPIDAGAQVLANASPNWLTSALDYLPAKMRNSDSPLLQTIGDRFFADPRGEAVNKQLADTETQYQAARQATAPKGQEPGFDAARLTGNVLSPVNAAGARFIPAKAMTTAPRMAATGSVLGASGGLVTPVLDQEGQENFGASKAAQIGLGAVTGAVATPVLGKVMEAAAPHVSRALDKFSGRAELRAAQASLETDNILRQALADVGQRIEDIPKEQMAALRQQVNEALKSGKQLDAAAIMRKQDFEALGIEGTLGQITRDPAQFARERNLRGVAGVGDPLMNRFDAQNKVLQERIGGFAQGASDRVTAGERISAALQTVDKGLKNTVDDAYGAARDHVGRAAPMDHVAFANAANRALDESMLGIYLPTEARSYLNGIAEGKIPFNVNTAVQIDQVLSSAQRAAGQSPQALAIGKVRDALNKAPIDDNVGADAKSMFDAARGMAKKRFALHEAIPALEAAANGSASADAFVRKFVLNGDAKEVNAMATMLKKASPEAFQEARAQIGAQLQRAAFGENMAGDKVLAPERLAKALRDIGPQKLKAFFDQTEIETMNRIARVGAYANSIPSVATVNTSNTASTLANIAGGLPGFPTTAAAVRAIAMPVLNQRAVGRAINAQVPETTAPASPEVIRRLQLLAGVGGLLSGGAVAPR